MSDPPLPEQPGRLASGRQMFDRAYARADAMLDHGQSRAFRFLWLFLPDTSIIRNPRFEQILVSRFFSDAGQQALAYGALIAVVRGGGNAWESALVGVAALVPPALFALYGGTVADQLPKRVALALAYNLQALLCFVVPIMFGTELTSLLFLLFAVNLLGQVSGPSESAVLPHVASREQLASAASLVSLSSTVGTAFGTAILAPVLVRAFDDEVVFFAAGIMLFIAATRVFDLPTNEPDHKLDLRYRPKVSVRNMLEWLATHPAVATMIFVAVLAGTASIVVQTLGPRYVQSVLDVDPADAVYVFAPSSLGLLCALAVTPWLVKRLGERPVAIAGFAVIALVLFGLGFVDAAADWVEPINIVRLVALFGVSLSRKMETAGFLAIWLGFGLALTQISVQAYINRRVPLSYQGRTFALQSMLKNGVTIGPLLTLGAIATVVGVQAVLIVAPFALLLGAISLVQLSYRFRGEVSPGRFDVLASYWDESDAVISDPDHVGLRKTPPPGPEHPAHDEHHPA